MKVRFGAEEEEVLSDKEFSLEDALRLLEGKVVSVLGYGAMGRPQALILRDQGVPVIVGQRQGTLSWRRAQEDGWREGETLFSLEEATRQGTFLSLLIADSAFSEVIPSLSSLLTSEKTLIFSHGFGYHYREKLGVSYPSHCDIVLVAPKGAGATVREQFIQGKGVPVAVSVVQNSTGKALTTAYVYGKLLGAPVLLHTDIARETIGDLVGERGVLVGALGALLEAQYEVLRAHGHSSSESFFESVEEFTQSLVPLLGKEGLDGLFSRCSPTALRGALEWLPRFKRALLPLFEELYDEVGSGEAAQKVIDEDKKNTLQPFLENGKALSSAHECWTVGREVRKFRS